MSSSAVSQRGNVVQQETDFFSIIVAILVLAIALGIHNGKNWARWSIFSLPVFGILFGSGFLLGLNLQKFASISSGIPILTSLVLFLPLSFTRKARLYFKNNKKLSRNDLWY